MEISKLAALAAILFSVCVTVASVSGAVIPIVVTNADNGKQISVPVGGSLDLQLQQAGATGYSWEIVSIDESHLKVLSTDTIAPKLDKPVVGAAVVRKWNIEALAKGHAELKAALYRPWEGVDKAAENFAIHIEIK
jgi:predicted secreted protein